LDLAVLPWLLPVIARHEVVCVWGGGGEADYTERCYVVLETA
jgi:hypothetical protein